MQLIPKPQPNNRRLFVALLLFAGVLILPWWATLAVMALALWVSPAEEIILAGVMIDVLYGTPAPYIGMEGWVVTVLACMLYAVASLIRVGYNRMIHLPRTV